ncbi:MAG: hypothetical protein Q4G50_14265 [Corynebacterium sp.]|uniref:hypothetical protein n=1 Tax=Corynebacterium sp. TaxID=1720 RepID=UPI0026DFB7DE|nr:hypothetical protein [Corynebacterium sp.]MDO5671151.1 hypothetical protein [Corynebacterium sp.]
MSNQSPRRLPEEIYVRRRVAAAVIILVLVGLLVWGLVAFAGRGGEDTQTTAAAPSTTTTRSVEETTTRETTQTSREEEEEETTESTDPSEPAEPKNTCELADLRIIASSDRPSYGSGVQPTFYMTVENPTAADCEINLDDAELRFEVYRLEDNERVWSDTDCYPSVLDGDELFEADSERRFDAVWSRRGSQPGQCNSRQDVGTGAFYLHAVIGNNASDAHTFNLG